MTDFPAATTFRPVTIPPTADSADFVEMVRLRNLVYAEGSGHEDGSATVAEMLPIYAPDAYEERLLFLALLDGEPVGRVGIDIPLEAGSKVVYWRIELVRSSWSRGVGAAAHELVERIARGRSRTVLQSWANHPPADGARVEPPTGAGSIPKDHAARFYLHHGHTLEQVERASALTLPVDAASLAERLNAARSAADGYLIVQWFVPTPAEHVAGYGWMKSRMITDAPAGALEFDEEVWDAARVARHDATYSDAGRHLQVTAAQHIASGELVAFTELVISKDRTGATSQEDTLVLKEHRGHSLGMLVKCAALDAWQHFAPASTRVITYNAEENRHMLDINEEMGFTPIGYEGAWKKVLDA